MRKIHMLLLVCLLLAACGGTESSQNGAIFLLPGADENTPATETTAAAETAVSPSPDSPTAAAGPIDDEEARQIMNVLAFDSFRDAEVALARVVAADDPRFIGVLIELFRARQIGLIRSLSQDQIIPALENLSDQSFGNNWGQWLEWYGRTDFTTPPGFATWKGRLLATIHPGFGEFLQDRHPARIRVEEIVWGGVVVDGIPALDNPTMLPAAAADYLEPWEPVFGLHINGDARAYPLRILDWHEMANDVVGGVPVSLAYCTLCDAAIAYDGRASDGNTYTFGSSGFLFRSNKLMYDRQTRTLWNQLTGEPVLGELAATDVTMPILPVVLTTWNEWRAQHPQTQVVDVDTGFARDYEPGAAYGNYFAADETMFPVWQRSDALATKEWIFALRLAETQKAYPLQTLLQEEVINDTVSDTSVALIAAGELITVDGNNQYVGPVTYASGAAVRAYERGAHTFAPGPDAQTVLDENGRSWQITEAALLGPEDAALPRLGGHLAYWFGWFAFYPDTQLYE